MGIFSKLTGEQEISLSPQGGLLLSAITMIAIDGDIDDDEISILQRLNRTGNSNDFDAAFKVWKTKELEDCIKLAANAMNQQQQLTAIANLVDIAMADGFLVGNEEKLLEAYVAAFDVPVPEIEKIVEVICIKNNKELFQ